MLGEDEAVEAETRRNFVGDPPLQSKKQAPLPRPPSSSRETSAWLRSVDVFLSVERTRYSPVGARPTPPARFVVEVRYSYKTTYKYE